MRIHTPSRASRPPRRGVETRWQDDTPTRELVTEGAQIDKPYLTVARIGEDRKETPIGSPPSVDVDDARAWLARTADGALGVADDVRLRVRLWRADRTPVRGIQTRVWPDVEDVALSAAASGDRASTSVDRGGPPFGDDTTDLDDREPVPSAPTSPPRRHPAPDTTLALRRPQPAVIRPATSTRPSIRVQARPAAPAPQTSAPMYAPPCPTCAASTTTTALLQSRIAELSAMLGTASTAVRDAQRAAQEAEQTARSRGRRLMEAEAEARDLRAAEKRLDAQVADLYNGLVQVNNYLPDLDD